MKAGDIIEINEVCIVTVVWCNSDLMQVSYNDLTRRLLKIDNYRIKILNAGCKEGRACEQRRSASD